MSELRITLTDETRERLEALAKRMNQSFEDCVRQALGEFVDNWEDHLRVVAALQEDEIRPVLRAVSKN